MAKVVPMFNPEGWYESLISLIPIGQSEKGPILHPSRMASRLNREFSSPEPKVNRVVKINRKLITNKSIDNSTYLENLSLQEKQKFKDNSLSHQPSSSNEI